MDPRSLRLLVGVAALALLVLGAVLLSGGDPAPNVSVPPSRSASATTASPTASPTLAPTRSASVGGPSASPTVVATPAPTPRPAPTISVVSVGGSWSGTWSNEFPDTADGALEINLTQAGADLEGTVTFVANGCLTTLPIQGAIVGDQITLNVLARDEVELEGDVDGSAMSGEFSMTCNNASGTWIVRRDG